MLHVDKDIEKQNHRDISFATFFMLILLKLMVHCIMM